ncbi:2,3-diketo-L-gulonate TRAP transporter small permease protein YiaM [Variovorax sp. PBS-H4]|uniref:TRAP transporter small permease n=1 Tax=Variovorax sp. PBS-H4 TaxID=434008 RepID=UPI0013162638|nr:TRAP transporter small permease [Variovorax sp. PBS-H4]VTU25026.1 2,3-diketo-L-gulonate TRAP transporter small permease protein YiaM [Variovorax sp. PBS-H4]
MHPTPAAAAQRGLFDRFADAYFRLIELVLVLCLGAMVIMVLGNVILRYGFNSGITVSEELSRFLFVWLVFLGAVTGMRDNAHLGVDMLVRKLPVFGRKLCLALSEVLMLLCCVLFFWGTWQQHDINVGNLAPVTELSMEWVFGVAYVSAGSMAFLIVAKLWRLFTGRLSDDELIQVAESEEQAVIDATTTTTGTEPRVATAVAGSRP